MFLETYKINVPTEIMSIIFWMTDINTLRYLLKISNFDIYYNEIDKIIKKYHHNTLNYWNSIYYDYMKPKIIYQIDNNRLGLSLDSARWPSKMVECVEKCLDYDIQNLKNLEDKDNIDTILIYNYNAYVKLNEDYSTNINLFKNKHTLLSKLTSLSL
jgi:hypothetical protein